MAYSVNPYWNYVTECPKLPGIGPVPPRRSRDLTPTSSELILITKPCDLSAVELRQMIGAKALSPVELLDSCLSRVEAVNAQVNGIVAIDVDRARAEAAEAEAAVLRGDDLGVLHGLPVGIKDSIDTAGLRTTYGSPRYSDHVPRRDASLVRALREAGAIVQMKTNLPEWGAGGNTFNPVYGVSGNPFAPELTCGGSSGGSAIALATGMLPLAHGSDNAGSLRIPASFCGVVGLRPSGGVVGWGERPTGLSHLHVQGPMARSVADAHLMLRALGREDLRDPLASRGGAVLGVGPETIDLASLTVAMSADLGGFATPDADVARLFAEKTALFSDRFGSVSKAAPDMTNAEWIYEVLRGVEYMGSFSSRVRDWPTEWPRLVAGNLSKVAHFDIEDVGVAVAGQHRLFAAAQDFFAEFDLLILPTVGVQPWPKHQIFPSQVGERPSGSYIDWVKVTYGITLLNHPAISIPCGVDERGLPFGIQLVAGRARDEWLLDVAHSLEQVLQRNPRTARPAPDLAWLAAQPPEDPTAVPVT